MLKLLKQLKKHEIIMGAVCIVFVLCQVYFDLQLPDYMSDLTSLIKAEDSAMSDILIVGAKMLACTLISAGLCVLCGYLSAKVAAGFSYTIRGNLFNHIMDLGQGEMKSLSVPSLITRTTNDVVQVQMLVSMGLQMLIKAPVTAVWAIIKIFGKSTELSLLTAGFIFLLIAVITVVVASVLKRFRKVQRLTDTINRITRENLTGINVVHAFNAEDYQNKKFDGVNTDMMNTQMKNQHTFAVLQPFMMLAMNCLSLSIFWLGAALLQRIPAVDMAGRLSFFSDVVVFSTYATYVVMSFMMMIMIFMMLPTAQVSAERINEVLETRPRIVEGTVTAGRETGTVEFDHVNFRYPGASDNNLTDISFKVNQGETLAIIGATGSGKSTLVNLISRFYDATEGRILIDGVDVKDYTFDALYNRLGFVTQKAILFSDTVEGNIRFGESRDGFTDEDIDRAIRLSQAEEFVSRLEGGKQSRIAQSGKNVSGGQKQRLSIARALARNAEILVFDDSFSALDYKTDAKLRYGLKHELNGTTCIIVAQRISTIRHADRILVLDNGTIVGNGTHDELMAHCPVYQEIAASQLSPDELQ